MMCSFSRCDKPVHAKNYCSAHYKQLKRGRPLHNLHRKPEERFWGYVVVGDGCWAWTGTKTKGYGQLSVNGKMIYAHRFSYILSNGDIPDHLEVRHLCNNTECTNPEHLEIGTHAENMNDCVKAGRFPVGERSGKSKLTTNDVLDIRASRYPYNVIAKKYNVDPSTISDIKKRKTWRHI